MKLSKYKLKHYFFKKKKVKITNRNKVIAFSKQNKRKKKINVIE